MHGLEKGISSLYFWTCVLRMCASLYLYIQHVESHLFSYVIAFEPSRSHKAVILFLSHFLPLFWYCPTQYSHHLSLPNIYCTLRSESLHMKIISNLLNPKGLFNLWNLESLKFWPRYYWSCSLRLKIFCFIISVTLYFPGYPNSFILTLLKVIFYTFFFSPSRYS